MKLLIGVATFGMKVGLSRYVCALYRESKRMPNQVGHCTISRLHMCEYQVSFFQTLTPNYLAQCSLERYGD
jgi:hypothetical protein